MLSILDRPNRDEGEGLIGKDGSGQEVASPLTTRHRKAGVLLLLDGAGKDTRASTVAEFKQQKPPQRDRAE